MEVLWMNKKLKTLNKIARNISTILFLSIVIISFFAINGCSLSYISEEVDENEIEEESITVESTAEESEINENGYYTKKEDVSLYIATYGKLPPNYISKNEARDLGWESSEGNLWEVTDQKSIGGDRFGNREGLLPDQEGRQYYECDINYNGGFRDAERLVYSNDGLIYYTSNHYETFERIEH